jgi:hypothetical protein
MRVRMSVVEDTRKVIQDFLAPELRSIAVRLDSLEKQLSENKTDLMRAINEGVGRVDKQRTEDKTELVHAINEGLSRLEKQNAEDFVRLD